MISPGIWLALPASRAQLLDITTLNSTPGGLAVSRLPAQTPRQFQAYALYRADINEHNDFSEENTVDQRAEALLRYRLKGGLSFELIDIYDVDQDPYSTGVSRALDRFKSNLLTAVVAYEVSPKLNLRADYSWYTLDLDAERNAFRVRDDNAVSLSAYYRALAKVFTFLEYQFIDIDYEENILFDSTEHHYLAGLLWNMTRKSRGRVSLGFSRKKLDDDGERQNNLIGEVRLEHRFTPKTSIDLRATRRTEESDIPGTRDRLSHRVQLDYLQRITTKISGEAQLFYRRDSYRGDITFQGRTGVRKDDYYGGGLELAYLIQRWLNVGAGYVYIERSSSFSAFDYKNNTVFVSLTVGL